MSRQFEDYSKNNEKVIIKSWQMIRSGEYAFVVPVQKSDSIEDKVDYFTQLMFIENSQSREEQLVNVVKRLFFNDIKYVIQHRKQLREPETTLNVHLSAQGLFKYLRKQDSQKYREFKDRLCERLREFARTRKDKEHLETLIAQFISQTLTRRFIRL